MIQMCPYKTKRFRDLTGCKADRLKEDCKVQTMSLFMWGIPAPHEAGKYFSFNELSQCVMSSQTYFATSPHALQNLLLLSLIDMQRLSISCITISLRLRHQGGNDIDVGVSHSLQDFTCYLLTISLNRRPKRLASECKYICDLFYFSICL